MLKKVANGLNEMSVSHEVELDVILGIFTELERMVTMLPVSINLRSQMFQFLMSLNL